MADKKVPKSSNIFYCNICNFNSIRKSQYDRHLMTRKHKILTNTYKKVPKSSEYECKCGNTYKHRQSLHKHLQKCNNFGKVIPEVIDQNTIVNTHDDNKIVTMLVQQNQEFKDLLLDQNKTIIELSKNNQTINNTHTNSHNKTFNLHLFLNETCKDAMNLSDFVKSLQLNFAELEKMGEIGFAEGLSRMFVRGLNELDITKRPIHCTDVKRGYSSYKE